MEETTKKKKKLLKDDDGKLKKKKKRLLTGGGSGSGSGDDPSLRKKRKSSSSSSGGGGDGGGRVSSSSSAAGGKKKSSSSGSGGGSSGGKRSGAPAVVAIEGDEDTWEGCFNADRRLEAVTHGVEWALRQLPPLSSPDASTTNNNNHDEEESDEGGDENIAAIIPALYALVRLTLDPVRQEILESLAPRLEAWKARGCRRAAGVATVGKGRKGERWGQAALIGAFRRVVQLEKLGVYARGQEAAKRALVEGYVSVRKRDKEASGGGSGGGSKSKSSKKPPTATTEPPVWDVQDLLGWNPLTGPLPEGLPDPTDPAGRPLSRLALLARSLEWAALVELSGLVRGAAADQDEVEGGEGGEWFGGNRALSAECRLLHVLKWLPAFRPYLGPAQCRSPREYQQQTLLAVSVVMALSRDGELRIPALLLPHEYFFLRQHLPVHLANRDVVLVGRSLDALRVLGGHDENPVFRAAMAFLLAAQSPTDGHWPANPTATTEAAPVAVAEGEGEGGSGGGGGRCRFLAPTLAAVRALLVREFRGFGPSPLESVDALLRWQRQDADPQPPNPPDDDNDDHGLLMPDGSPDPRLAGMAARVQAVKAAAKRRAASAAPAPVAAAAAPAAPAPAVAAAASAPAVAAAEGMGEMERRVVALMGDVEAAKGRGDWAGVLAALEGLAAERMTVAALGVTGVGKVVNKLRKAKEHEGVAELSKRLVEEWKGVVNAAQGEGQG